MAGSARQDLWRVLSYFGGSPPRFVADIGVVMYCVYVLKSLRNNKRYIGYTSKTPQKRMEEHNSGTNQFTKGNRPYELIHYEFHESEDFAKKRERFLKSGNGRRVLDRILLNKISGPVAQMDRAAAF